VVYPSSLFPASSAAVNRTLSSGFRTIGISARRVSSLTRV